MALDAGAARDGAHRRVDRGCAAELGAGVRPIRRHPSIAKMGRPSYRLLQAVQASDMSAVAARHTLGAAEPGLVACDRQPPRAQRWSVPCCYYGLLRSNVT